MWRQWEPYVSVAERRRQAKAKMATLRKRGVDIQPVEISGQKIAKTFWGQAWCDHLEGFSDYENRLPRGRTYVRNGSVCHLAIAKGKVEAKVSGREIYDLRIQIKTLKPAVWRSVKRRCAGQIGSLLELLQGNLSDHVMQVVTDRQKGLFPQPGEIKFDCDCPDWAMMCKHVAAVLYAIGARLDERPELLFTLRGVNHEELIDTDAEAAVGAATRSGTARRLATHDLADVFGIDIEPTEDIPVVRTAPTRKAKKKTGRGTQQAKKPARTKKKAKRKPKRTAKKTATPRPARKKAAKKQATKKANSRPAKKKVARKKRPRTVAKKTAVKKAARKKVAKKKAGKKAAKKAREKTSRKIASGRKKAPKRRTAKRA